MTLDKKLRGGTSKLVSLGDAWNLSEKDTLIGILKKLNIGFKVYKDKQFIADEAIKAGATESICIRDNVDIAFDKNGKVLGSYTNGIKSYVARKKKKL